LPRGSSLFFLIVAAPGIHLRNGRTTASSQLLGIHPEDVTGMVEEMAEGVASAFAFLNLEIPLKPGYFEEIPDHKGHISPMVCEHKRGGKMTISNQNLRAREPKVRRDLRG
jgi:hypothetical protein